MTTKNRLMRLKGSADNWNKKWPEAGMEEEFLGRQIPQ
jgi:hypothetical protein